jgi:hypothetical protein
MISIKRFTKRLINLAYYLGRILELLKIGMLAIPIYSIISPLHFNSAYRSGLLLSKFGMRKLALNQLYFAFRLKPKHKGVQKLMLGLSKTQKNIIMMDVRRGFLFHLSLKLRLLGYSPAIWIGYSRYNRKVKEEYPDCEIYDYFRFNKGGSLYYTNINFSPPREILASIKYLTLKDKVFKMMDRQDRRAGLYRRLEREAVFFSMFCYFYSKFIEKDIKFVFALNSPHLPLTATIYGIAEILNVKIVHMRENVITPVSWIESGFPGRPLKKSFFSRFKMLDRQFENPRKIYRQI